MSDDAQPGGHAGAERHDAPSAYVFDAYGTLFDVHAAVRRHMEAIGPEGARLSEVWRAKQLEYSWVRALTGRYRDFWTLTEEALDFAFAQVPGTDRGVRGRLLEAYRSLDCYAEVPDVLRALRLRGARLAVLSNGSPGMLRAAVESAGIDGLLDDCLSVDALGTFKTVPATYAMVTEAYGCRPDEVAFHSSNRWDVAGATGFGFRCTWVNRTGQPDEYADLPPERVVPDLTAILPS